MIRYDREVFGSYNVANLLRFLIGIQNEVGDKKHRDAMQKLINEESEGNSTVVFQFLNRGSTTF